MALTLGGIGIGTNHLLQLFTIICRSMGSGRLENYLLVPLAIVMEIGMAFPYQEEIRRSSQYGCFLFILSFSLDKVKGKRLPNLNIKFPEKKQKRSEPRRSSYGYYESSACWHAAKDVRIEEVEVPDEVAHENEGYTNPWTRSR